MLYGAREREGITYYLLLLLLYSVLKAPAGLAVGAGSLFIRKKKKSTKYIILTLCTLYSLHVEYNNSSAHSRRSGWTTTTASVSALKGIQDIACIMYDRLIMVACVCGFT